MARTQQERKAETRTRLLDAAADLFARRGLNGVSAEAVCDAADRTTGALYSHFGGKDGLLVALLDEWRDSAAAGITAEIDPDAPLDDRLAALWRNFASRPTGGEDAWILLEHELWLYAARNAGDARAVRERYGSGRAGLGRATKTWAAEAGSDTRLPARETGALVLALLLGLEMQRRLEPAAVPDALAVEGLRRLLDIDRPESKAGRPTKRSNP